MAAVGPERGSLGLKSKDVLLKPKKEESREIHPTLFLVREACATRGRGNPDRISGNAKCGGDPVLDWDAKNRRPSPINIRIRTQCKEEHLALCYYADTCAMRM